MQSVIMAIMSVSMMGGPASAAPGVNSGVIESRVQATFSDGSSADRLYRVKLSSGGETYLRVACSSKGAVSSTSIVSPRDASTGMASGKRMHKPFKIMMELDRSSSGKAKGKDLHWDIKEAKGARVAADGGITAADDWSEVSLHGAPALCD